MTDVQRRILAILAGAVALVFVAVGLLALVNQTSDTTTTTASAGATTTTAPSTTSSSSTTTTETTTTTSSSTTTTTTPTTTTIPPSDVLILGPENIDGIPFGTDPESAITTLVGYLGEPVSDTGWVPPTDDQGNQVYGPCPGTEIRVVEWSNLTTVYTDAATPWAAFGIKHLFFYSYVLYDFDFWGLTTAEGIGLGSTAQDLRDAYGDAVDITSDEFGDYYSVTVPAPGALWGFLEGPGGTVNSIQGGVGCGE
ncbi:MAG: hypothetical protein WAM81_08410 [Acidimicrobiia bacterium]